MKGDILYRDQYEHFRNTVLGFLPGIGQLIKQSSAFIASRASGDYTGSINSVNRTYLHYSPGLVGTWGVWRTESVV